MGSQSVARGEEATTGFRSGKGEQGGSDEMARCGKAPRLFHVKHGVTRRSPGFGGNWKR